MIVHCKADAMIPCVVCAPQTKALSCYMSLGNAFIPKPQDIRNERTKVRSSTFADNQSIDKIAPFYTFEYIGLGRAHHLPLFFFVISAFSRMLMLVLLRCAIRSATYIQMNISFIY